MNIFYLHADPYKAPQYMYNRHVVKMILETAQLLCTAHHEHGKKLGYSTDYVPYKSTHVNHPSAIWARENISNYVWLYDHFVGLCSEYTKRYGKVHKSLLKCKNVLSIPPIGIKNGEFNEPPQCMPDQYKVPNDSVTAYWNYYEGEKYSVANNNETRITRTACLA